MSSSLGYSLIEGFGHENKNLSKNNKTRRNKITKQDLTEQPDENNKISPFKEGFEQEESDNYIEKKYPDRDSVSAGGERLDMNEMSSDSKDPPADSYENKFTQFNSYSGDTNKNNQFAVINNSLPIANEAFENSNTDSELTQKLNYMIQLLEEQHDDKIKSVTEEVILYGFLGVFIIYIVDSFAKIGKYVR